MYNLLYMKAAWSILKDINIVDYISKFIKLNKRGKLYWSCCPFHEEKTPSFAVNNDKNFYYCFGCGAYGDIISFTKNYNKSTIEEAAIQIANEYNIELPNIDYTDYSKLYRIMYKALELYSNNVNHKAYIDYIKLRQISSDTINIFRLGYAYNNITITNLINSGFSYEELNLCGLTSYEGNDRLANKLIIPIINIENNVIGFGGRTLSNESPKYINSPETPIFQKSYHLYGENLLQHNNEYTIIVEGYFDVISLYDNGYKNIVGAMGTNLTEEQMRIVWRYTNKIYIMFDGDSAGDKAINNSIPAILASLSGEKVVYICFLPTNTDPCSLVIKNKENINSILNNAIILSEYIINTLLNTTLTVESRALAHSTLSKYLSYVNDTNLKNEYKLLFTKKLNMCKMIPKTPTINLEDKIFYYIINDLSLFEELIEEFMQFRFKNVLYEEIRQDIIDEITINETNLQDIHKKLTEKFSNKIIFLRKNNNFCDILPSRCLAIKYIKDSLNILSSL